MTKKELSQCYYINREIKQLQNELAKFEGKEYNCTNLTGLPKGSEISDAVGRLASERADLYELISLKVRELMLARNRIERYINRIESSEMRMIIRLRHINGMKWDDVANSIGMSQRHAERLHGEFIKSCH